jgi:hypothetical protein
MGAPCAALRFLAYSVDEILARSKRKAPLVLVPPECSAEALRAKAAILASRLKERTAHLPKQACYSFVRRRAMTRLAASKRPVLYRSPDHRQLVTDVRFAAKLLQPPMVAAAITRW